MRTSEDEDLMQKYTKLLKDVGNQIRCLRKDQHLSQFDLASSIDADRPFITNIENGNTNVTLKTLVRIANALKKDLTLIIDHPT